MRAWILGAPDPEMERIAALLGELGEPGEPIWYAMAGGARVRPETAYRAETVGEITSRGRLLQVHREVLAAVDAVIAVECGGPAIPPTAIAIDHHRRGDPGYGRPPSDFLPASSLGQVIAVLVQHGQLPDWPRTHVLFSHAAPAGTWWRTPDDAWAVATGRSAGEGASLCLNVPADLVLAAAADHCLAAAYRGECPGVDPDALMRWRVETRAAHQGRSVESILIDLEAARRALRSAPRIDLGGEPVADLRGRAIPELPEAAAREGIAFLATPLVRPGERQKVVLQCASPAQLAAWPAWAAAHGLVDLYGGDPARGFAGGYLP
ncbi:MAG TPA: hypothetical protein VNI83_04100 [Vicinamibacterales bacterium]|nr:hypothetical protein [Vicinamibacterales bacterium]